MVDRESMPNTDRYQRFQNSQHGSICIYSYKKVLTEWHFLVRVAHIKAIRTYRALNKKLLKYNIKNINLCF